jgi:hypothetical protein
MSGLLTSPTGEQHGLINTLGNSVKDDGFKHMDEKTREKAIKLRKEESRMVKARYINHRGQHERLTKPYCRWAGDPIRMYHFIPDEIYEVPLGLVNEINDPNKKLPQRSELMDKNGVNYVKPGGGFRLHEFVAVGF